MRRLIWNRILIFHHPLKLVRYYLRADRSFHEAVKEHTFFSSISDLSSSIIVSSTSTLHTFSQVISSTDVVRFGHSSLKSNSSQKSIILTNIENSTSPSEVGLGRSHSTNSSSASHSYNRRPKHFRGPTSPSSLGFSSVV